MLSQDLASVDSFDIAMSLGSAAEEHASAVRTGTGLTGTIEVDFATKYPAGQPFTVVVTALHGPLAVGSGRFGGTLKESCDVFPVDVQSQVPADGGDFGAASDLLGDLMSVDLSLTQDLSVQICNSPLACSASAPVCDSGSNACRACQGPADDSQCAMRGAKVCRTAGPNVGRCEDCNLTIDCAATPPIPVCDTTGVCRKCRAHSECSSGVCKDDGTCADTNEIVFVQYRDNNGGSCLEGPTPGSQANPYCQIGSALSGLGGKKYIVVGVASTNYTQLLIQTTITVTIIGPGETAPTPASVQQPNDNAVHISINGVKVTNVTIDGLVLSGALAGSASAVVCDAADASAASLTIKNSVVRSGFAGINASNGNCSIVAMGNHIFGNATGVTLGSSTSTVVLEGNKIESNAVGVSTSNAGSLSMLNNFVYSNTDQALNLSTGVIVQALAFNTIALNGSASSGKAGGIQTATNLTVEDSIVFGNYKIGGSGGSQFAGAGTVSLSNVVTGTDTISSAGKLSCSPLFANVAPGSVDLHLHPADTCAADVIDGAPDAGSFSSVDIDGEMRPKGTKYDVGADEAQ